MHKLFFTLILLLWFSQAEAKSKINDIKFKKLTSGGVRIEVLLDEKVDQTPSMTIKGRHVELLIPESSLSPKIVKKLSLQKKFDTLLVGRKVSQNSTKVTLSLPYVMSKANLNSKASVVVKGQKIVLVVPLVKRAKLLAKSKPKAPEADGGYDESYLQKLLKDKKKPEREKLVVNEEESIPLLPKSSDTVATTMSASPKEEMAPFSFTAQAGKFAGLLILVIGIFYGLVLILKKSIFRKGKLGFLHSTKVMEVLSTTYLAPKRTAILLRVHKQIFLIGSSEKGLVPLGELGDITGLLKQGEEELGGNNFDSSLQSIEGEEKEFNLKKALDENNVNDANGIAEDVKLSEQIKNKLKDLKPLQ